MITAFMGDSLFPNYSDNVEAFLRPSQRWILVRPRRANKKTAGSLAKSLLWPGRFRSKIAVKTEFIRRSLGCEMTSCKSKLFAYILIISSGVTAI
jgi:hypothetical protein